ncbi:hypothetical protein ACFY0G_17550 [Streptomyces sp. NPDC001552]|uniref:hypothetical protein n=1 Tax=Streptomyces sp. NPDC001552 TaxID=3364587 RepID=UPI0036B7D455
MTATPARRYAEHLAAASPLAAAALAFGDLVEATDARRDLIRVHHFDTSQAAREAADLDLIADEDVVVIPSEGVVGFMVVAYAAAVTEARGALFHLSKPARDYAGGAYIDSVLIAEREARALGLPLRDAGTASI